MRENENGQVLARPGRRRPDDDIDAVDARRLLFSCQCGRGKKEQGASGGRARNAKTRYELVHGQRLFTNEGVSSAHFIVIGSGRIMTSVAIGVTKIFSEVFMTGDRSCVNAWRFAVAIACMIVVGCAQIETAPSPPPAPPSTAAPPPTPA